MRLRSRGTEVDLLGLSQYIAVKARRAFRDTIPTDVYKINHEPGGNQEGGPSQLSIQLVRRNSHFWPAPGHDIELGHHYGLAQYADPFQLTQSSRQSHT